MIIAFLSLLFLLPGCKEEKTQSVFDADEFDCVGWPHIRKVTITNVNCEAEGIFLILEDSLVYCDDEIRYNLIKSLRKTFRSRLLFWG